MMDADSDLNASPKDAAGFFSTRWSLVVTAGDRDGADARAALETLCTLYWPPLYAYIRRQGFEAATAEDLTQGFLVMVLERGDLARANPERGRFRSFLLTAVKHFLINEQEREQALKRGGGHLKLSLDFPSTESRLGLQPAEEVTPETLFERQWALTLLDRVRQLLQNEYISTGRHSLYARLEGLLTGAGLEEKYSSVALELGMSEGAVKVAAHRLRQRFGEILRQEIAQTVASPDEIDGEIRDLFDALRK